VAEQAMSDIDFDIDTSEIRQEIISKILETFLQLSTQGGDEIPEFQQ
jgi:hypothetical protein